MNYSILFQSPVVGSYFLFHWLFALMWFCASKRLLVPLHTLDYGKCWSLTEVQTAGLGRCTSHLSLYRWASSPSSSSVLFCVHGAQNSNLTNQPRADQDWRDQSLPVSISCLYSHNSHLRHHSVPVLIPDGLPVDHLTYSCQEAHYTRRARPHTHTHTSNKLVCFSATRNSGGRQNAPSVTGLCSCAAPQAENYRLIQIILTSQPPGSMYEHVWEHEQWEETGTFGCWTILEPFSGSFSPTLLTGGSCTKPAPEGAPSLGGPTRKQ